MNLIEIKIGTPALKCLGIIEIDDEGVSGLRLGYIKSILEIDLEIELGV